ncbi:MAG: TonB-dependent receptor [Acidobacteriota bacterium]
MTLFAGTRAVAARAVVFTMAALLFMAPLPAQGQTGEIRIEVKDASGAGMQASGKLQNLASGVSRSFHSDPRAPYAVSGLPFGTYRLEVSRSGFTTQTAVIVLDSASPVLKTISMPVGTGSFQVDVVGLTPLAGVDLPVDRIPAPVQTLTDKDLASTSALDLSQLMNRRLEGVHINETQGNPFQPDLNYRGYTASPLLGTPEGISVYMDGVRLNQPFGDVVSWDLIPKIAIQEVALIPGSNPLFGLNTLGGSLSLQTKDGASKPGTSIQASGGSFGRRAVEFDHGWANSKGFNWYGAGNLFHEDGWRQASPSDVRQAFSKVGWQGSKTSIGLTGSYADNALIGNGVQEQRFLARDYTSVYTIPDSTNNIAPFLNFTVRHTPTANLTFSGNAYFRYIRADTVNGDINENSLDQSVYQPSAADIRALTAAGYTGFPTSGANASNTPFPYWRCIAQALQKDEPGEKCNGQLNRTYTKQHNYGLSGQMTWLGRVRGSHNQFTLGAAHDRSSVGFQQTAQLGYLNPDRTVTTVNAIEDGVNAGNVDGVPLDARVDLRGLIHTSSIFATDSLQVGNAWAFSFSGRYNRTIVNNTDRIRPGGGPGSLDGHNIFQRFNPAIGATYSPNTAVSFYGSYSEGSRAPTSIELGCADPAQPCRLPNALAGDPPLKQVVTRTLEAGVRGRRENGLTWNAGWFWAQNYNDILFVSSTSTGFGYFKNFGRTRRDGVEASLKGRIGHFTLGGGYTFLNATYQSAESVDGSSNSANDQAALGSKGFDGVIQVKPGNRIPLIPQHLLKAYADYQATSKLSIDLDFNAVTTSYARGNENNLSRPDGIYYLGPGTSPGYGVVNLGAHYQIVKRVQIFAQINNLLNHHYYTAAQLGPTGFTNAGTFIARPFPAVAGEYPIVHATFYAPGAPIGAFGGVKVTF